MSIINTTDIGLRIAADRAARPDAYGIVPTAPTPPVAGPIITRMADVQATPIRWLWRGRIPSGRVTLLVGRPGEGKSYLTTDIAARISTGTPYPDGAPCELGSVLLVSGEDDPSDTIRPRLDAAHADVSRIHLLAMVRRIDADGEPHETMYTLADVTALEQAIQQIPDLRLIVIDPIGSYLGGSVDAHRDSEVRSVLAPVAALAARYDVAVLIVAHRRKSAGDHADDTALGSRAFTGLARAVWHLSRDPEDRSRRLLLAGKCNIGPESTGLAFSVGGTPPALRWERDPVEMSADDGMHAERNAGGGAGRPPEVRDAAADWLQGELSDYAEHPVSIIRSDADAAGIGDWRTVQRAATAIGVLRHRATFGGAMVWRLPRPGTPPTADDGTPPAARDRIDDSTPQSEEFCHSVMYAETPTKPHDSRVTESIHDKNISSVMYGNNSTAGGEV